MAETVVAHAADVIEEHLAPHASSRRLRERAEGAAEDLHRFGLLAGGQPRDGSGTIQERVAATLQARYNWPLAEQITTALADADLLANERSTAR